MTEREERERGEREERERRERREKGEREFHFYLPVGVRGKGAHGKGMGFPEQGTEYLKWEQTI